MKKYLHILTLTGLLFSLTACEEKKVNAQKDQNTKSVILDNLSSDKPEKVIEIVDEQIKQGNSGSELLYYKASALSKKGGIDIFSLYPIFEMKLFSVSAFNWDELNKFDNPYKKFFVVNTDKLVIQNNNLKKKTVEFVEKMIVEIDSINEKNIKNTLVIVEELNDFYKKTGLIDLKFEGIVKDGSHIDHIRLDELLRTLQEIIDDLRQLVLRLEKNPETKLQDPQYIELNEKLVNTKKEITQILMNMKSNLQNSNLKFTVDGFIQIDSDLATIKLNQLKTNIMDILWTTYQTLPMLAKLPRVSEESRIHINEAIKLLETVYDRNDEYRKNSGYYLSFLSAIMFVNSVLNMSNVEYLESVDFVCGLSEAKVKANLDNLNFYVRTLEKGLSERKMKTEFFVKVNSAFQSLYSVKDETNITEKNFDNILQQVKDKFCQ